VEIYNFILKIGNLIFFTLLKFAAQIKKLSTKDHFYHLQTAMFKLILPAVREHLEALVHFNNC